MLSINKTNLILDSASVESRDFVTELVEAIHYEIDKGRRQRGTAHYYKREHRPVIQVEIGAGVIRMSDEQKRQLHLN